MPQIPLDEHGSHNTSGVGFVVILMLIFFVPVLFFGCLQKRGQLKKLITTEQFKNVQVGDFSKGLHDFYGPIREIIDRGDGFVKISVEAIDHLDTLTTTAPYNNIITFEENHTRWDSLALRYFRR